MEMWLLLSYLILLILGSRAERLAVLFLNGLLVSVIIKLILNVFLVKLFKIMLVYGIQLFINSLRDGSVCVVDLVHAVAAH